MENEPRLLAEIAIDLMWAARAERDALQQQTDDVRAENVRLTGYQERIEAGAIEAESALTAERERAKGLEALVAEAQTWLNLGPNLDGWGLLDPGEEALMTWRLKARAALTPDQQPN